MADERPTWITLSRDITESARVVGNRKTVVSLVLDAETGMVVAADFGTAQASTVGRALKDALIRPAPPVPKTVPGRIVCSPDLVKTVHEQAAGLSKLVDTAIVEGVELLDAEEVLDGLVGHLIGRGQPHEAPQVSDWRLLYDALAAYADAEPWQRWSDDDYFAIRIEVDGDALDLTGIVLGSAGIQRGFNLTRDPDALLRASTSDGDPLRELDGALIVHLSPWRQTSDLFATKARRYGWDPAAAVVPELLTVRGGTPADLSLHDARVLALALQAVVAQDARRLAAVDSAPVTGEIAFDDARGRFEIARP